MSGRAYEHAAPTVVAVDAGAFDKTHINDMIGCRRVLGGTEDSREIVARSSHNIDPSTGLLHGVSSCGLHSDRRTDQQFLRVTF